MNALDSAVLAAVREMLATSPEGSDSATLSKIGNEVMRHARRKVDAIVSAGTDGRVAAGPFAGMRLDSAWRWCVSPCLLGIYEAEIQDWIEAVIVASPKRVIDVGCGDGYYAVGLAMRLPEVQVIAADGSETSRSTSRAMAMINGVADRVAIRGEVSPADLQELLAPGDFVLSDCEGFEDKLLDPAAVPALRYATIIVELHDFIVSGVSDRISERFSATHRLEFRAAQLRDAMAVPLIAGLPPAQRFLAVNEGRPPMQWAKLTPKA